MSGREIDLEGITALVEGKLSRAKREQVIQHLADSEEAYHVFAEAMAETHGIADPKEWEEDEKAIHTRESRLRKIREKLRRLWDAFERTVVVPVMSHPRLAAIPVVAVVLALIIVPRLRPGAVSVYQLASSVDASQLASDWHEPVWPVTRGVTTVAGPRLSFRLGVRLTDLQLAVQLGDTGVARRLAVEVDGLIAEIPFSQMILLTHRRLEAALDEGAIADTLSARVGDVESLLEKDAVEDASFEYGKWVESARLAALSGDAAFFASKASRDLLKRVRRGADSDATREEIAAIEALMEDGPRLTEIEAAVTAIIEAGGP